MADLVPQGLHHVTCVCNDWEVTREFYDALGFSLVKNTVNHDAPDTRHTYHGDAQGSPGSVITFFEWPSDRRARPGLQSAHHVALDLPSGLGLEEAADAVEEAAASPPERVGEASVEVADPDGLSLRLFEGTAEGPRLRWVGLYGAVRERERFYTDAVGFELEGDEEGPTAVLAPDGSPVLKLLPGDPGPGRVRPGGVHHVAFLTDEEAQQGVAEALEETRHGTNGPIDRHYFTSLYSRDPGRHVIEFATPGPGFTVDEDPDELGASLVLPPWLEERRASIEQALAAPGDPR